MDDVTPTPAPAPGTSPVSDVTAMLAPFLGNTALVVTLAVMVLLAIPAALAVRRRTGRN